MRKYPIALAALLLASPAMATPQQDTACVVARLSADDITTIVDESLTGASEQAVARLTGPIAACSGGQNWTPGRRAEAAAYAIGVLDRRTLGSRLRAGGIDSAALDRWFVRQSLTFRTTAFMGMAEAEMYAAINTLADHEVSTAVLERDGRTIGGYLAARVVMERIERGLGIQ